MADGVGLRPKMVGLLELGRVPSSSTFQRTAQTKMNGDAALRLRQSAAGPAPVYAPKVFPQVWPAVAPRQAIGGGCLADKAAVILALSHRDSFTRTGP